jgi:RHS repeat-associated protein
VEYDSLDRITKTIDPLNNETQILYDEASRVSKRIDANGGQISYTYDDKGRLTRLTDSVNNATVFEYDYKDHIIKETNALGQSRYFEYLGQWLIRKTDRNERVTEYVYDRFGRQKEEKWFDNKKLIKTITNRYESAILSSISDGFCEYDLEVDSIGREIKNTVKLAGFANEIVLHTNYDRRGLRTMSGLEVVPNSELKTRYIYNQTGKLESAIQNNVSVLYSYNKAGQKVTATTPALTSHWNYDNLGRPTHIQHRGIADYDLKWDAANRIVSIDHDNDKHQFDYDKTNQIVSATSIKHLIQRFRYDLNGNRTNFNVGRNNRLLNDGESTYNYDHEGNRISKDATKYFWDHRNRLVKVETPKETVEYSYDYQNRLVKRSTSNDVTFFVYDGWHIVMTLDGKETIKERFLWGAEQDELIAIESGDKVSYILSDHQRTIRDIVDSNGKKLEHRDYDVFGNTISTKNEKGYSFGYTGKLFDNVTGLQWNINRWYDPKIGKWISEDHIGFKGNDTNLTRYATQNPITMVDHLGLQSNIVVVDYAVASDPAPKLVSTTNISSSFIQQLTSLSNIYSGNNTQENFLNNLSYNLTLPNIFNNPTQENFSLETKKYECATIYKIQQEYQAAYGTYMPTNSATIVSIKNKKFNQYNFNGNGTIGLNKSIPVVVGGLPLTVRLRLNVILNNLTISAKKYSGIVFDLNANGAGSIEAIAIVGKIIQVGQLSFGAQTDATYTANFTIGSLAISPTNLN